MSGVVFTKGKSRDIMGGLACGTAGDITRGVTFTEGRYSGTMGDLACGTVRGIFCSPSSLLTRSLRALTSLCRSWICKMSVSVADSEVFSFPKIVELNAIKKTNNDTLSTAIIVRAC